MRIADLETRILDIIRERRTHLTKLQWTRQQISANTNLSEQLTNKLEHPFPRDDWAARAVPAYLIKRIEDLKITINQLQRERLELTTLYSATWIRLKALETKLATAQLIMR